MRRAVATPTASAPSLVRKNKCHGDLQQPGFVAGLGPYGVVIGVDVQFYRLFAEPGQLAEPAAERDGPFAPTGDPVRRDVWRRAHRPSVAEMIADDGVEQKLVGPVAAAGWAAKGPDVVDDGAEHPRAFVLF